MKVISWKIKVSFNFLTLDSFMILLFFFNLFFFFFSLKDIQIFVLIKYEGDGVYYPTAVNFKSQYDVDEFLGIHHLQSVDLEGRPTGTHRTRKYKDLIPESYYIVA